jgi:hypothetical protein
MGKVAALADLIRHAGGGQNTVPPAKTLGQIKANSLPR